VVAREATAAAGTTRAVATLETGATAGAEAADAATVGAAAFTWGTSGAAATGLRTAAGGAAAITVGAVAGTAFTAGAPATGGTVRKDFEVGAGTTAAITLTVTGGPAGEATLGGGDVSSAELALGSAVEAEAAAAIVTAPEDTDTAAGAVCGAAGTEMTALTGADKETAGAARCAGGAAEVEAGRLTILVSAGSAGGTTAST
jgi:hypothetical protein